MRQIEIPVNIEYLRTLKTIADIKAISSQLNMPSTDNSIQGDDNVQDRSGNNQYHQINQKVFTPKSNSLFTLDDYSLTPAYLNFTKKEEAIRNIETQKMLKELGVEII